MSTTSDVHASFGDSDSLILSAMVASWHPTFAILTEGCTVWVVVVQPTFWGSDRFNFKCHGCQLAPNRCNLDGGSVWVVVVQPSLDSISFSQCPDPQWMNKTANTEVNGTFISLILIIITIIIIIINNTFKAHLDASASS